MSAGTPAAPGQAAYEALPPKWTGKYRKRPVVIEAVQLTRENAVEVWEWASQAFRTGQARDVIIDSEDGLTIRTLEGDMRASFGDWIIKGVKGEFYPCRDDIFAATYEDAAVAAAAAAAQAAPAEVAYLYHRRFAGGEEFCLYRHAADADARAAGHAGAEVLSMAVLGSPEPEPDAG